MIIRISYFFLSYKDFEGTVVNRICKYKACLFVDRFASNFARMILIWVQRSILSRKNLVSRQRYIPEVI